MSTAEFIVTEKEFLAGKKRASFYNICLIDDDPDFRNLMQCFIPGANVSITCYSAIRALPQLNQLNNFDVVILDYYLENCTGVHVAEYLQNFFPQIPVVLTSAGFLDEEEKWPKVIKGFVPKGLGPAGIIQETLKFIS